MDDDVKALVRPRRGEIARKQIVFRFAYLERVFATRITFPKPLLADRVRNIEEMKFVGHIGLSNQRTHPIAIASGVSWEIENDRKAVL